MSDNVSLEFVDTNILVYAHDQSARQKQEVASAIVSRLWDSKQGCLSVQILQEFFVTVTRKVPRPLKSEEAAEIIRDLSYWRIHSPSVSDVLSAIDLQRHYQISFWDAMAIQSAKYLGCKMIWSEDLGDGQMYDEVQVINPFHR